MPEANTAMLIRRPVSDVFQAFVDPAQITKFWFTDATGPLAPGARVTWTWAMYGVSSVVVVREFVENERIAFSWGDDDPSSVEWTFQELEPGQTFVEIRNFGFGGTSDEQVAAALDSTGGFALVLAGAKAWLEHGLQLNLVGDRFPPAVGHD